jgi:hypothetical protein
MWRKIAKRGGVWRGKVKAAEFSQSPFSSDNLIICYIFHESNFVLSSVHGNRGHRIRSA